MVGLSFTRLRLTINFRCAFHHAAMKKTRRYPDQDIRVVVCQLAIDMAGGPTKLARAIGIKPQAVSNWELCPGDRCMDVQRLTGISIHRLRPDLYGVLPGGRRGGRTKDRFGLLVPQQDGSQGHADTTRPDIAKALVDGRKTESQGDVGSRRDGSQGGHGNGHWPQRRTGPDLA
jgi:hypothetical protein